MNVGTRHASSDAKFTDKGMKVFIDRILRIGKWVLIVLGSFTLVGIILAFTSAPFWIRYNMGNAKSAITGTPAYIVVLGGGGIPSSSGLMRTYYGAKAGKQFPNAKIIVALPGEREDSLSSVNQMKQELVVRGIAPERILLEDSGMNTRAEALLIIELITNDELRSSNSDSSSLDPRPSTLDSDLSKRILLITSPTHLYRSVLTFEKAGFKHVDGIPAFERDLESNLLFSSKKLGGRKWVPDVGENLAVRYRLWNYLEYELMILREWVAIAYYWLMGWI